MERLFYFFPFSGGSKEMGRLGGALDYDFNHYFLGRAVARAPKSGFFPLCV